MKINKYFKLVAVLFIISYFNLSAQDAASPSVKNIIYMIGDGMAHNHVYSAMTKAGYKLNMEKFPYSGFQKTFSLDNYVTDSAAGGTALATGTKTKNGVIGQDSLGNDLKSILSIAGENGLATGIVVSCAITHATPAAFFAHQPNRSMVEEIAMDFIYSGVDIAIGGGYDHFAKRKDNLNLIDSLTSKGYTVVKDENDLKSFKNGKLAAFLYPVHPPAYSENRGNLLPDGVTKAIELLSKNEKGFFLMVEGSQIDWSAHKNDLQGIIDETLDFDRAIGIALDFAIRDGNTLVVVTADHETGGMAITGGSFENKEVEAAFTTGNHTAAMVPVFSYGPGAEKFSGIIDNTDFVKRFREYYGFNK